MSNIKEDKDLIKVVNTIKAFKETNNTFYRDNESDYYHKILEVIEFFQDINDDILDENSDIFMRNFHVMNDFKDLFLELYNDKNYATKSAKKTNFYHTIDTLCDFTRSFKETTDGVKITTAMELEKLQKKLKEMEELSQDSYDEYQKRLDDSTVKLHSMQREFFDAKRAIEEDNRLYTSKEYWSKKKQKHRKIALILSATFTLLVVLLVLLAWNNISKIDNIYLSDSNITNPIKDIKLKNSSNSTKYLLISIVESLLILSLLIWMARIILKIIFSNLHLKEEAYEKETMIVTYLALIKEGGGLKESDRSLILESIFRPSTNGLIKDESSVTLLDVANVFKGK